LWRGRADYSLERKGEFHRRGAKGAEKTKEFRRRIEMSGAICVKAADGNYSHVVMIDDILRVENGTLFLKDGSQDSFTMKGIPISTSAQEVVDKINAVIFGVAKLSRGKQENIRRCPHFHRVVKEDGLLNLKPESGTWQPPMPESGYNKALRKRVDRIEEELGHLDVGYLPPNSYRAWGGELEEIIKASENADKPIT
jgi:hypothetical protein